MAVTELDANQVIKHAYDEAASALRISGTINSDSNVSVTSWSATATVAVSGDLNLTDPIAVSSMPGVSITAFSPTASVTVTNPVSTFNLQSSSITLPVSGSVSVSNFPAVQAVSGDLTIGEDLSISGWTVANPIGVSGSVSSTVTSIPSVAVTSFSPTASVTVTNPVTSVSVSNFPSTQAVSGSVSVGNFPSTQAVSGSISVSNQLSVSALTGVAVTSFSPTASVLVANTSPIAVSGDLTIGEDIGVSAWSVSAPIAVSGSVSLANSVAVSSLTGVSVTAFSPTANVTITNPVTSVSVSNFPTTQAVSGSVNIGTLPGVGVTSFSPTANVSVVNFPATQAVSGSVSLANSVAVSSLTGVSVTAFSPTASVTVTNPVSSFNLQSSSITLPVSGSVSATITNPQVSVAVTSFSPTASVSVVNLPSTQAVSGSVSAAVTNFPATQAVSLANSVTARTELTVVDFLDTILTPASSLNSSTGALVQVVASLASTVKSTRVADTTGYPIGFYSSSTATPDFTTNPGADWQMEWKAASGASISARYLENISTTAGNISVQFLG